MEQEELKPGDWVRFLHYNTEDYPEKDYEPELVTIGGLYQVYNVDIHSEDVQLIGILNPIPDVIAEEPDRHWWFQITQVQKVNEFQERIRDLLEQHEDESTF